MSGGQQNPALNGTGALGPQDQETDAALLVFNIVMISLASCVLTVTALYCVTACYSRTRQSKRAFVYESAVSGGEPADPVSVRAVKRSTSFINPLAFFRKPEGAKDNSRIYYIYSNPLPVGLKEDEEEERGLKARESEQEHATPPGPPASQEHATPPSFQEHAMPPGRPSFQEYAKDPGSGVVLEPPIFYMQL